MALTKSPVICCKVEDTEKLLAAREVRIKAMAHIATDPYKPPEWWMEGSSEFRLCHYFISIVDELVKSNKIETWEISRKLQAEQGFFYPLEFGAACSLISMICGGTGDAEKDQQ